MTIFANRHRSGLICDEQLTVIELFWHAWQGAATLVGASAGDPFHVYYVGCIGDGSGMCHLIAQHGHL